jgi:NitT/TauT family transport system permease protein
MSERARVLLWRLAILIVLIGAWEWLTGIKAISKTPGLYWIDPFFVSRPSLIVKRFAYLASDQVRLSIWQMALSTVQSTLWGFVVGVSTGFAAGLTLGRNARLASVFEPYIIAFNSLPRIALVPLITMIFGFGLLAKIVLAWTIVFFIVFFNTFQGARSVDADLIHPPASWAAATARSCARSSCRRRWRGRSPRSRRPSPSRSSASSSESSWAASRAAASATSSSSRSARSTRPT